jgi:hypothetical protein
MRIIERTINLGGICYLVITIFKLKLAQIVVPSLLAFFLLFGFYFEGIRVHQFPFLIGFITQLICTFNGNEVVELVGNIVFGSLLGISILLVVFGECNFSGLKLHGPY